MIKNKKMLILNLGVLLSLIFSAAVVIAGGGHYTLHTHSFSMVEVEPVVEVSFDREGVVQLSDYYMQDGELILEFDAVGKGETNVRIRRRFHEGDEFIEESDRTLSVGLFNVVTDRTNGDINFNGYLTVANTVVGVLSFTWIMMLWMFLDYRRRGDFCYPMIACGGVSIYCMVLSAFLIYKLLNNGVFTFGHFLQFIREIGLYLLLVLIPVMFVLSILLFFSNILLMRHEGRRPVNALGIAFGILWFIGTLLTVGSVTIWFFNIWNFPHGNTIMSGLTYIICYFECMFLSTAVCSFLSTKYLPARDRDYIIILGCGINRDGTLMPLLRGRVDSAIRFEREQAEKTGKHAVFVPSGGQGSDEIIPESEAMARYLLSQGIPSEQIVQENKSTNTFENMQFSKNVIESHGGDIAEKKVAFATTNYHVFRGYILAKKNGFDAKGISAKTKAYFYPNAFLREFIGLLAEQKWKHLAVVILLLVLFIGLPALLWG